MVEVYTLGQKPSDDDLLLDVRHGRPWRLSGRGVAFMAYQLQVGLQGGQKSAGPFREVRPESGESIERCAAKGGVFTRNDGNDEGGGCVASGIRKREVSIAPPLQHPARGELLSGIPCRDVEG
jgi:hypothetical protein